MTNCNKIIAKQKNNNLIFKSKHHLMVFRFGGLVNNSGSNSPQRIYNENLTPQITGLNNNFTTQFPLSGGGEVKLNGITQTLIDDYIILNSTQIQFTSIPNTLDHILISYNKL